jgi:hypothetical protein
MDFMEDLERQASSASRASRPDRRALGQRRPRAPRSGCDSGEEDRRRAWAISASKLARSRRGWRPRARSIIGRCSTLSARSRPRRWPDLATAAEIAKLRRRLDDFTRREAAPARGRAPAEEARRIAEEAARAALKEQGMEDQIEHDQPLGAGAGAGAGADGARRLWLARRHAQLSGAMRSRASASFRIGCSSIRK